MADRVQSRDLKPGTKLRWRGYAFVWGVSEVVVLARRKDPAEHEGRNPFFPGWWLAGDEGGLADFVIDAENSDWEVLGLDGTEGAT